jgi:hypothetical protein
MPQKTKGGLWLTRQPHIKCARAFSFFNGSYMRIKALPHAQRFFAQEMVIVRLSGQGFAEALHTQDLKEKKSCC